MNRVQVFGHGDAEVKIYPIKRKGTPYRFFQIAWYELGGRRTKTFADPLKAKAYAQQAHVSLLNQGRIENVTPQDIQMFRDAEAITASFGVSLPFAVREWTDARKLLGPGMLTASAIWARQASAIGRVVKFRHQPSGAKEAPRFPKFLGFRERWDMSPEVVY